MPSSRPSSHLLFSSPLLILRLAQDIKTEHNTVQANIARGLQVAPGPPRAHRHASTLYPMGERLKAIGFDSNATAAGAERGP